MIGRDNASQRIGRRVVAVALQRGDQAIHPGRRDDFVAPRDFSGAGDFAMSVKVVRGRHDSPGDRIDLGHQKMKMMQAAIFRTRPRLSVAPRANSRSVELEFDGKALDQIIHLFRRDVLVWRRDPMT